MPGPWTGGKEDAVPWRGTDLSSKPGAFGLREVLGYRSAELAILADQDVRQAAVPTLPGELLPPVQLSRGWLAPPGITTAPTYSAWNTRNGVSAKYPVNSTISCPNRRSGLSVPKRFIASA